MSKVVREGGERAIHIHILPARAQRTARVSTLRPCPHAREGPGPTGKPREERARRACAAKGNAEFQERAGEDQA